MSVYSLVVFVHVAAACLLIAATLVSVATRAALRKADTARELLRWLSFTQAITRASPVLAMTVLATGMYLTATGGWQVGWVYATGGAFVLSAAVFAPRAHAGAAALAKAATHVGDGPVTPELDAQRWALPWDLAGSLLVANDFATLFLMTNKPGLAGSLAVVGAANVLTVALRWLVLRARRATTGARAIA